MTDAEEQQRRTTSVPKQHENQGHSPLILKVVVVLQSDGLNTEGEVANYGSSNKAWLLQAATIWAPASERRRGSSGDGSLRSASDLRPEGNIRRQFFIREKTKSKKSISPQFSIVVKLVIRFLPSFDIPTSIFSYFLGFNIFLRIKSVFSL